MEKIRQFESFMAHKGIVLLMHMAIIGLSIWLIVLISVDTFDGVDFYAQPKFHREQFWICVVFLTDFFIEFFMAREKGRYLATHFIFFLVSIPYQSIIYHYGWQMYLSKEVAYLLRYMPLIRGGYAMAIVVGWFTGNKATSLFLSYIITLFSTVYFASLTFFLFEKGANPLVKQYSDALWWAAMDVTTVGSNIVAVTGVGRVLSVLLAALGMMMFPIFTVYVTNIITSRNSPPVSDANIIGAFRNYLQQHPEDEASPGETAGAGLPPRTADSQGNIKP